MQLDHNNLLSGDAPMLYRHVVLEPGGSMSANDLVKNFLGRPQNMTADGRGIRIYTRHAKGGRALETSTTQ